MRFGNHATIHTAAALLSTMRAVKSKQRATLMKKFLAELLKTATTLRESNFQVLVL